jgi:predicted ABC-type ATPase
VTTLLLTRGLPGSGKTTEARRWVAQAPPGHRVYVDRDSLRMTLFGRPAPLTPTEEDGVTVAQHAMIIALLQNHRDVVVADTFLRRERLQPMYIMARKCGAIVEIIDLLWVPVETCVERDATRAAGGGRSVGAKVIRDMAARADLTQRKP